MKIQAAFSTLKDVLKNFSVHKCVNLAAALSYYTLFSIGPFLAVLLAFAALFFGRDAVSEHLFGQIRGLIGKDGAETIQSILDVTSRHSSKGWAAALGTGILFWGATGIFLQIQDSFNIIWEAKLKPREKGWVKVLRNRFLSFGLILGLGFLLLVSLALNTVTAVVSQRMAAYSPGLLTFFTATLDTGFSLVVTTLIYAAIYKFLPDVKMRWRDVWPGSLLTAGLFAAGRVVIGLYLANNRMISAYGAAASLILLILWVNYSAMILFFGAEFIAYHTKRRLLK